jgi:hypothetical protein
MMKPVGAPFHAKDAPKEEISAPGRPEDFSFGY